MAGGKKPLKNYADLPAGKPVDKGGCGLGGGGKGQPECCNAHARLK